MGVRNNRRLAEDVAENQIGGFAADPRDFDELRHRARYLAVVVLKQILCGGVDVARLGIAETAGTDDFLDVLRLCVGKRLESGELAVEILRDDVDTGVRTLGGQPGGKQQLIILLILQGADGVRIFLFQQNDGAFRPLLRCQIDQLLSDSGMDCAQPAQCPLRLCPL